MIELKPGLLRGWKWISKGGKGKGKNNVWYIFRDRLKCIPPSVQTPWRRVPGRVRMSSWDDISHFPLLLTHTYAHVKNGVADVSTLVWTIYHRNIMVLYCVGAVFICSEVQGKQDFWDSKLIADSTWYVGDPWGQHWWDYCLMSHVGTKLGI